ncbi:hypothetical protein HOY82DRAFT_616954 [Tuber indicum]|nr:hypothetical protein HOY82DRAFT_616954 [Tuber indicum]
MAFLSVRRHAILTMAHHPYGNLIFLHRRQLSQSGSVHEDEETSGPGTTVHKTTVDKDTGHKAAVHKDSVREATVDKDTAHKPAVDGDKVETESLFPIERISKLEEGLKNLASVVDKGFNRQELWIRWIIGFGVGTVLLTVFCHDEHLQDRTLEKIGGSKSRLQGEIRDLRDQLQGEIKHSNKELGDKFAQTLQLSLGTLKSDILFAIAKEELQGNKKNTIQEDKE